MIATMRRDAEPLRLQVRGKPPMAGPWPAYRMARSNGWHCGHWHRTPEDAVACAIGKGEPMD